MSLENKLDNKKEHNITKQALNAISFGVLGAGIGYATAHLTIENINMARDFLSYDIRSLLKDNQELIELSSIPMSFFGWSNLANKRYKKTHNVPEKSSNRKLAGTLVCGALGAIGGAYLAPEAIDFFHQTRSLGISPALQIGLGALIGSGFGTQVYDSYLK